MNSTASRKRPNPSVSGGGGSSGSGAGTGTSRTSKKGKNSSNNTANSAVSNGEANNMSKKGSNGSLKNQQASSQASSGMGTSPVGSALLDFHRILHAMEEDCKGSGTTTTRNGNSNGKALKDSERIQRLEHAEALWKKVAPWIGETDPTQAQRLEGRLNTVKSQLKNIVLSSSTPPNDAVQQIFFTQPPSKAAAAAASAAAATVTPSDADRDAAETLVRAASLRSGASGSDPAIASTTVAPPPTPSPPPAGAAPMNQQDLQSQQREQMESAIRQMAATLKNETKKIHSTLQTHNRDLTELEVVASDNVQAVSEVAKDVEQNVKNNWNRTLGTWTMIFTVVGAFVFCLLTIVMIPKANPYSSESSCWFFCSSRNQSSGGNDPRKEEFCRVVNGVKECHSPYSWQQPQFKEPQPISATARSRASTTTSSSKASTTSSSQSKPLPPKVETEPPKKVVDHKDDKQKSEEKPKEKACELDLNGECINISEGALGGEKMREEIMREYMDNYEATAGKKAPVPKKDDGAASKATTTDSDDNAKASATSKPPPPKESKPEPEKEVPPPKAKIPEPKKEEPKAKIPEPKKEEVPPPKAKIPDLSKLAAEGGGGGIDEDAFGVFSDSNRVKAEEKVPIYNGRPFSTRDIRKAAASNQPETLRGYLGVKPEWVNSLDGNGWTALHLAARAGHMSVVKLLLDMGADASIETKAGKNAAEIASEKLGSSHAIVKWINEKLGINEDEDKEDEMEDEVDDKEKVKEEEEVADVGAFTMGDVHWAAASGDLSKLRAYLKKKPEWANEGDQNRWNAVHVAARAGRTESVKVLIEYGADVHITNNFEETALDIVMEEFGSSHELVKVLKNAGK